MERVRQPKYEFSKAIRPALFATTLNGEQYLSSHGGCVTIGWLNGRPFALTCRHVIGDYNPHQLVVSESLWGETCRGINGFIDIKGEREDTAESELEDIAVCTWLDPQPDFPLSEAVNFDQAVDAQVGDCLVITGFPKSEADYFSQPAKVFALQLETTDMGVLGTDRFLRMAGGISDDGLGISDLSGFSGGLVFNITQSAPSGLVVRGGIDGSHVMLYYVSISTVLVALERLLPALEGRESQRPHGTQRD